MVAQITGVRVRETVPDSILDRADAVELVDLTPDDLIQRLKEGKVYVPKQAERALKNYFSPTNLTALRELALAAHRRARGRAAARADAGPGHLRSLGRGRAHPGVRERGSQVRRARALRQAAGGPAARALDGAVHRDAAKPAVQRDGARPDRRDDAGGRAARRRGHHAPRRRPPHRRRRAGLRPQAERHAHRHRQVHALALVRDPARLGGARPRPARRQHRRARDTRRGERAHSAAMRKATPAADAPKSLRPAPLHRRVAGDRRRRRASAKPCSRCSASRTSISCC